VLIGRNLNFLKALGFHKAYTSTCNQSSSTSNLHVENQTSMSTDKTAHYLYPPQLSSYVVLSRDKHKVNQLAEEYLQTVTRLERITGVPNPTEAGTPRARQ
jgi:hypothetical protein